jgi:hypothetical protein
MNRTTISVGAAIVVVALGCFAAPEATTGHESFGFWIEAGVLFLGIGVSVVLWGSLDPDPRITTIGGFFGNRDEDAIRKWVDRHAPAGPLRYRPSPLESVNCENCYTAIPARSLMCPRCGRNRLCRNCRKPLFFLAGAVRCGPCVRDELFCACPRAPRPPKVRRFGIR